MSRKQLYRKHSVPVRNEMHAYTDHQAPGVISDFYYRVERKSNEKEDDVEMEFIVPWQMNH